MAAAAKIREETGIDVETLWGDDGFVMRFPDVDEPPEPRLLLPDPDEVQALVVRQLGATALFAAKFRENAARSLLLPKRRPGMRAPLWQQRKRAADLLAVASRYGSFPVLLETYRECLRDFFDMPALVSTLTDVRSRKIRVATVDSEKPSPFAASLLFSYVASFLYDGDAPLAERRAQALAVDQSQLRELLGDAELRELLDAEAMDGDRAAAAAARSAVPRQERRRRSRHAARHRRSDAGRTARTGGQRRRRRQRRRARSRRAAFSPCASPARRGSSPSRTRRGTAMASACRCRPAFPSRCCSRCAIRSANWRCATRGRTRRSRPRTFAARYALGPVAGRSGADAADRRRAAGRGRVPSRRHRARMDGRRRAAHAPEPLARQTPARNRAGRPDRPRPVRHNVARRGEAAARRRRAARRDRAAAGRAAARLDSRDRNSARADRAATIPRISTPSRRPAKSSGSASSRSAIAMAASRCISRSICRSCCRRMPESALSRPASESAHGESAKATRGQEGPACIPDQISTRAKRRSSNTCGRMAPRFLDPCTKRPAGAIRAETVDALWNLAWKGLVTNDTFHALRAFTAARAARQNSAAARRCRCRRVPIAPPRPAVGRGPVDARPNRSAPATDATRWSAAVAQQLLARHGVVTREGSRRRIAFRADLAASIRC